ncbi:protein-L-isoaspartate(D-aspartate) O-methyltransferase, partial [Candidatus Parcubacteria bacterium]|nr:protein-L-isoaspartate(D-aspartate) O-methyltransferase [Candidatus Parcubacteria bacterium]
MNFQKQRQSMVKSQLEARGIADSQVLDAFLGIPREAFVPRSLRHLAYADAPLTIGHRQTISQPYTVAVMTEALGPFEVDAKKGKVLEVGTGSGYQAAILAQLFDQVVSIECVPELAEGARQVLAEQGIENVTVAVGDGSRGWPEEAPYDAIIVTAAGPRVPPPLLDQL